MKPVLHLALPLSKSRHIACWLGSALILFLLNTHAQNWVQTSAPIANWSSITCSQDFSWLAASISGGGIWASMNGGVDWFETAAVRTNWAAVDASPDGARLVAAVSWGGIYRSADSGTNWIATSAPVAPWTSIATSEDGSVLAGTVNGGSVHVSWDSGNSWRTSNVPNLSWLSIAMSPDGTKLVATSGGYNGSVYSSSNSGLTWNQATPAAAYVYYQRAAMSTNGGVVYVTSSTPGGYHLWRSTTLGQTWHTVAQRDYWGPLACSADGTWLAASASGRVYVSANSGTNAVRLSGPDRAWVAIASSGDGGRIAGITQGGGIYIWELNLPEASLAPQTQTALAGTGASISASTLSPSPLHYQWVHDGAAIPGATGATVELGNLQPSNSGNYALWLTNSAGANLSSNSVLQVVPAIITSNPSPAFQTLVAGSTTSFSVAADTTAPLSYFWYHDGIHLPGYAEPTITLSNIELSHAGRYSCVVSNSYGTVTSAGATLSVVPSFVTSLAPDYSVYEALFNATSQYALESWGWFEWGPGTNLDNLTPVHSLPPATEETCFSAPLTGLQPYTEYQFRPVVSNLAGVVRGPALTFTTSPPFIRANVPRTNWTALAMTADATRAAAIGGGRVYISTNSGGRWEPTDKTGAFAITSTNGDRLLVLNDRWLYTSTNFGLSWKTNWMPARFTKLAASADATRLFSMYTGQLCTSSNAGSNWIQLKVRVQNYFGPLASSHDGKDLLAITDAYPDFRLVLRSQDFGVTWNSIAGLYGASSVAVSPSADIVLVVEGHGSVARYTNGAPDWTFSSFHSGMAFAPFILSANSRDWAVIGGSIFLSRDWGLTWFQANIPPGIQWYSMAASADGHVLMAAGNDGVYISRYQPTIRLDAKPLTGAIALSWPGPSPQFVLQQRPDLLAGSWHNVTNQRTLNLTNLHFELTLPTALTNMFYRLAPPE